MAESTWKIISSAGVKHNVPNIAHLRSWSQIDTPICCFTVIYFNQVHETKRTLLIINNTKTIKLNITILSFITKQKLIEFKLLALMDVVSITV